MKMQVLCFDNIHVMWVCTGHGFHTHKRMSRCLCNTGVIYPEIGCEGLVVLTHHFQYFHILFTSIFHAFKLPRSGSPEASLFLKILPGRVPSPVIFLIFMCKYCRLYNHFSIKFS